MNKTSLKSMTPSNYAKWKAISQKACEDAAYKLYFKIGDKLAKEHPGWTWKMLYKKVCELMIRQLVTPPDWTGYTDCAKCGIMPAPEKSCGEKLNSCAWCEAWEGLKKNPNSL